MFSKKLVSTLILVTGLVVVSQSARGESTTYVGVNVAKLDYSEDESVLGLTVSDASITAFYGRVGTQFHENFAVEFRAGTGGDDTVTLTGSAGSALYDVSLENFFGVYFRGILGSGKSFRPYAIAGFARFKLKASNIRVVSGRNSGLSIPGTAESSETDVSFGIGADIKITDDFGINVEYMKHTLEVDGTTLGLVWSF